MTHRELNTLGIKKENFKAYHLTDRQTQAVEKRIEENKSKAKARSNQQKKVIKEHNEEAEKFRLRTGLDYSLENWQSLASGHKMSQEEIDLFTKKAFP